MNNAIPCVGGNNAILEIINNDCNCVGIASVTDNRPQSNTFTIVYTNGQSQSFPFLQGNTGPAGGIGPVGPAGQNGSNGAAILYNDLTVTNNGSSTSLTTLKSYSVGANLLSVNGSEVRFRVQYEDLNGDATIVTNISFGGIQLASDTITPTDSISDFHYDITIVRTGPAAGFAIVTSKTMNGNVVVKQHETAPFAITPIFSSTNNIVVAVTADIASSVNSRQLEVVYYQFGTITPASNGAEQSFTAQQTVSGQQAYTPVLGFNGGTIKQLYLDGNLLAPTGAGQWSYDNTTDTLTFNSITITSVQWIQGTYTA